MIARMGKASGEDSGTKLLKPLGAIFPFLMCQIWTSFWPPLRPAEAPEMELQILEVTSKEGPLGPGIYHPPAWRTRAEGFSEKSCRTDTDSHRLENVHPQTTQEPKGPPRTA